ncbi:VOC family protein [Chitinophaga lutea]
MATVKTPEGIPALSPYFLVKDAESLRTFMLQVFGAEDIAVYRNDNGGIMHAEMRISGSVVMFGQSTELYPPENGSVFLYVADTDATYRKAMEAGATSREAPGDKDYGRAAGFYDPFGNSWWITAI